MTESVGQISSEAHELPADGPGGQHVHEAQDAGAAREPFAGHMEREAQMHGAGDGADLGQTAVEAQNENAEVRATINQIIETGRENAFAIRQRMRVRQATLSYIARVHFGYHTGLKDTERKKAMDAAAKLIKAVQKGEDHPVAPLIAATDAASAPWEKLEHETEKALIKLARKLPAYAWVKDVRGFGDLSFARIIAETGDLSGYDNPAKVWKRLGLAVIDGRSQRRTRDAEKAVEQGYSPRRRAVAFVAFEPVLKAQSAPKNSDGHDNADAQAGGAVGGAGHPATEIQSASAGPDPSPNSDGQKGGGSHDHDAVGAIGAGHRVGEAQYTAAGPYRALYDHKKADYMGRVEAGEEGWSKLRAHRAAMRYASKRMYRDLWVAWHRAVGVRALLEDAP